jgi:3-hydroxyisobutyrate dehydrogenase
MTTVAVLGTGIMGAPMARNLAAAGFTVRAWNRTREKAQPLVDDGITVTDTAAEAADGADIVLTMLFDGDAVEQVMRDVLPGMGEDAIWLQMSTVGAAAADRLVALAREHGVGFVDAPVAGTKQPAEQGTLLVLASGDEALRERVQPLFDVVGQRTVWVGPAGSGSRLKLVVNGWVLAAVTALGEALALAEGLGLDPALFLDTIKGGGVDMAYAHLKGSLVLAREFPAAFPVSGAVKDAGLVVDAADATRVRAEVAKAARQMLARTSELGHADEDMAAVWYAARGE